MANREIRSIIAMVWSSAQKAVASPRVRRYRSRLFQLYILLAILAFSGLALLANTTPYFSFDLLFTRDLQEEMPMWMGLVLQGVSWPGYGVPSVSIIAVVVIFLAVTGLRWEAASALFAAASSGLLNYLVKVIIRRPRPSADLVDVFHSLTSYSFPSGHVMFYTAFFGFLLFLTFILLKRSLRRAALIFLFSGLVLLVGVSRMYLGEHWASDVVGGYLLGSLVLILSIQFYHWGKKRFIVEQPVAPSDGEEVIGLKAIPITAMREMDEDDTDRPARE